MLGFGFLFFVLWFHYIFIKILICFFHWFYYRRNLKFLFCWPSFLSKPRKWVLIFLSYLWLWFPQYRPAAHQEMVIHFLGSSNPGGERWMASVLMAWELLPSAEELWKTILLPDVFSHKHQFSSTTKTGRTSLHRRAHFKVFRDQQVAANNKRKFPLEGNHRRCLYLE